MKLVTISFLWTIAILPLLAEEQPSPWVLAARRAQAQLKAARFAEAADEGKQALRLAKRYGPSDARLASTYHLLGLIYREWGHCGEARSNYAQSIAIWERQPEPNPRFIFTAVTNLLALLGECEDFAAEEKEFRVYQADLERYRTSPLDDARLLSIRAILARGRNDFTRSEALFRQAIETMEKAAGAFPVDIAGERSNLGVILGKLGRHEESLAESLRAIEFFEREAPRHPALVASLNNAACSLASLGRRDESDRMFQRAMQAAHDMYGEDNRITAKIMLSYARLLRENNESPAADALRKKGIEAFHRSLARDNGTIDAEELKTLGK